MFFIGVLYHLRHPLLALDLIHEHVTRDLLVFQSMQRGSEAMPDVAPDYDFTETAHFDQPGYPKMHFIEHELRARQHQLVGAEPRLRRRHAAQRRLHDRGDAGARGVHLPPRATALGAAYPPGGAP